MKTISLFYLFLCIAAKGNAQYKYPKTSEHEVVDDFLGNKITDDYRSLENTKDSTAQQWFEQQADYSNPIIANITGRHSLAKAMQDLNDGGGTRIFLI